MTDYAKKQIKHSIVTLLTDPLANAQITMVLKGLNVGQFKDYTQLMVASNKVDKNKREPMLQHCTAQQFLELLMDGILPQAVILDSAAITTLGGSIPVALNAISVFFYENTSIKTLYMSIPKAIKKELTIPTQYLLQADFSNIADVTSLDVLAQVQPISNAMCIRDFTCLKDTLNCTRKLGLARKKYSALRKNVLAKANVRSCITVGNTVLDFQNEVFTVENEKISLSYAERYMLLDLFFNDKRDNKERVMLCRIRKRNPLFLQGFNAKLVRWYSYVR